MADGDLTGEADDDVETQRGYAEDADLNKQTEAVFVQDVGRKADQDNAGDHRVAACGGGKHGGVRRIGGAEVAGWNEGLACHDRLHPLDVFGAEQDVGLDHQDDDQRIERRDFVEIAPVQIFTVEKVREIFQQADDDAAEHRAADTVETTEDRRRKHLDAVSRQTSRNAVEDSQY